jgi:hypothetical protein
MTTSGVARGKNSSKLVADLNLNSYLETAIASIVPRIVEMIVAITAIRTEFPNA